MHIDALDLNLLRLFDAVHRTGNVSRAAELLHMTQPAASQGLSRLRALLGDPLFVRAAGGMAPTPRADRMAGMVRGALATLEQAVGESARFDPAQSRRVFRLHLSDIGEARFLPALMAAMRARAPGVHIETEPVPPAGLAAALDSGRIDLAIGFLPRLQDAVQSVPLLHDRYVVLLRADHPFARQRRRSAAALLQDLRTLDFVAVRSHADTLRILQMARLDGRVRLTTEHFMVLPSIVRATDLAVVMPRNIARGFAETGGYAIVEPAFALRDFTVGLHWSHRFEAEPGNAWLRALVVALFQEPAAAAGRSAPG
ncbi:LysR family transcriptional regulator [Sphingomonas sp. NCPPB 2930]